MRRSSGTIQGLIDGEYLLTAYCHNPRCNHSAGLDLLALRDKLGPDHGSLHDDLAPLLVCSRCKGKKVGLILAPAKTPRY